MAHQLTPDELAKLTGAKMPKRQMDVLRNNHIAFITNARNHPVTTWEAVNHALTGATEQARPAGFNLAAAR